MKTEPRTSKELYARLTEIGEQLGANMYCTGYRELLAEEAQLRVEVRAALERESEAETIQERAAEVRRQDEAKRREERILAGVQALLR